MKPNRLSGQGVKYLLFIFMVDNIVLTNGTQTKNKAGWFLSCD